jgi:hypothetical protein
MTATIRELPVGTEARIDGGRAAQAAAGQQVQVVSRQPNHTEDHRSGRRCG